MLTRLPALDTLPPGTKQESRLPVPGGDGGPLDLPLLLARGRRDGPRIAILGGVHGDEYEGITAAAAVWRDLDPAILSGLVVVVPVSNPPAYEAGTRSSPVDGRNLARSFPGRPDGTVTERIAHVLAEAVIRPSDLSIDLHSAGQHYAMPLLCGSYDGDDPVGQRARAAGLAFAAPIYWGHPFIAPGRSATIALEAGIPAIYTECGGGGRVRAGDLHTYHQGVRRVLAHLGALPVEATEPAPLPPLQLHSDGNVDRSISVGHDGILIPRVRLLDRVEAGQPLGDVLDGRGNALETIRANVDGLIILMRRTARVRPGDGAYLVVPTERAEPPVRTPHDAPGT